MDGGFANGSESNCKGDCLSSRRRRAKKYNVASKRKRGFSGMKSRLRAQKALLLSEVERVTKQNDHYKNEADTLNRFVRDYSLTVT